MSIDWTLEPDLDELRRAADELTSDPLKALHDLERLAERGSLASMLFIGQAYESGSAGHTNLERAEEWYRRAADAGQIRATFALGRLYQRRGDHAKARVMYERGANAGHSPSMRALAMCYFCGRGASESREKSREWWKEAITSGNIYAIRDLGCFSVRGKFGLRYMPSGIFYLISAFYLIAVVVWKDR